jgi:hypothetical protein
MREQPLGRAVCSKHAYTPSEGAKVLNPIWVRRFLRHCQISG